MVVCIALAFAQGGQARTRIPAKNRASIILKALTYDDNLKKRTNDVVRIAFLHASDARSKEMTEKMYQAVLGMNHMTVSGRRIEALILTLHTSARLAETLASRSVHVLYVGSGLAAELKAIMAITRKNKLISVGGEKKYVENGLSFGLFLIDGRPRILVNAAATAAEGISFRGALLRHALILR